MKPDIIEEFLFQPDIIHSIWNSVTIAVMIVRVDDSVILDANPQAKKIFSKICPDMKGKKINSLGLWPGDQHSKEFLRKIEDETIVENYKLNLNVDHDSTMDFLISTDTVEESGIRYKLITMHEITQLKIASRNSEEKELMFESAVNNLKELVIIHDKGKILFANEIFKRTFGLIDDEHLGRQVQTYIRLPKYSDRLKSEENNFLGINKPEFLNEIKLSPADGSSGYYSLTTIPLHYFDQQVLMTILTDITERKNLEQEMMGKALESVELERNLLVENLHDDLGPDLSTIRLLLSSIDQLLRNDEPAGPRIAQCLNYIDNVISKLKFITADISPDVVGRFGLDSSLKALIGKMTEDKELRISVKSNLGNLRFSSKVEINLYRVIAELIENTLHHSDATMADLKLRYGCSELSVVYRDNGKGFDVRSISLKNSGSGILNIINRINSLSGKIDFKEYEGTIITVIRISTDPVK